MSAPTDRTIADASSYLDSWLSFRQNHLRIPGVQAAVLFDDDVAFSGAYGHADIASGTSMTPRHLFRIASHSKTFTATAVFQLLEAGRLRLDDTLATHLDWIAGTAPDLAAVTVRELLAHGGGVVRDGAEVGHWTLEAPFPDQAGLRAIVGDGASILPRNERFKYSNIGYSLLGAVLAAVSGEPYNDLVTRTIVDALGLKDTAPELIESRLADYATGYSALSYAETRVPIDHVDTGAMSAATGFTSTAEDVCRYAAAHFHGDERLLSDASKRLMQRDEYQVQDESWYGLGLAASKIRDRRVLGHGGGYPGHATRTLFDPVDRFAVAVLTNAIDGPAEELATGAVKLIDLAAEHPGTAPAGTQRFCGRFANLWSVLDVVCFGDEFFGFSPTAADPTDSPIRLKVEDETTLRITETVGFGAPGEALVYDFDGDTVRSLRGGGGMTLYPIEDFRRRMAGLDRVRRP